jgi:hypothetical protein
VARIGFIRRVCVDFWTSIDQVELSGRILLFGSKNRRAECVDYSLLELQAVSPTI